MSLKKVTYLFYALVLSNTTFNAQSNLLNASLPNQIGMKTATQVIADHDKPLPYGYIDDRYILWSKMVWEYIDLNEKLNLPYYYPADTSNISGNRRSLFDTLLKGIKQGIITEVYDDSDFEHKINRSQINQILTRIDTTDVGKEKINFEEPLTLDDVDETNITSFDIEGFKIKSLYYFDK